MSHSVMEHNSRNSITIIMNTTLTSTERRGVYPYNLMAQMRHTENRGTNFS